MKNVTRILAIVMTFALIISCAACGGVDMSKMKGDWTVSTINGQSVADYAANLGLDEYQCAINFTIDDKNVTCTNAASSVSGAYTVGSDGIKVTLSEIEFGIVLNADGTLSYKMNVEGTEYTYVLVKGTSSLTPPAVEGGEEDYGEEEYYEE